ncbi:hypothetical protein FBZ92_12765 [Nitrospirillum viridazoti]|uniref:Uncharacterized protein n=1 Tax=Nitrospirillum amazonense TaxID=28077 RepID=A0A560HQV6_9PROT|nr:hypothetical protein FBZ92_12765 [Nitrospirillum amazonense]
MNFAATKCVNSLQRGLSFLINAIMNLVFLYDREMGFKFAKK